MRRLLWAVLFGFWLLDGAVARAAERLQVPQLPGWKVIANVVDRNGEATELIPQAETADGWTQRATIQAFRNTPMTAAAFLDQVKRQTAHVCDDASAGPASMGEVGGREAGSRTVACGRYKGDGKGSLTLYFVIRGASAFYVVSRAWRGAPFSQGAVPVSEAELADWVRYMNAVDLCDPADPRHQCQ